MAEQVNFDIASKRINEGEKAGEQYVSKLESIRESLADDGATGSTLGTMVGAQLKMTETESQYMVEAGLPKKASAAHQAAAQDVKKASG